MNHTALKAGVIGLCGLACIGISFGNLSSVESQEITCNSIQITLPDDLNSISLRFREIGSFWDQNEEIPVFNAKLIVIDPEPKPLLINRYWIRQSEKSLSIRPAQGKELHFEIRDEGQSEGEDGIRRADVHGIELTTTEEIQVEFLDEEFVPLTLDKTLENNQYQLIKAIAPFQMIIRANENRNASKPFR